jgi:hypothetical protein
METGEATECACSARHVKQPDLRLLALVEDADRLGCGLGDDLAALLLRNAAASGDNDAIASWPVPKISCLQPSSMTNFASSSETVCEVP